MAQRISFDSWYGFLLRLLMAYGFLSAGIEKAVADSWTAQAYLSQSVGPLSGWFQQMAGSGLVDGLVVYGEIAIGFALFVGLLIRPAALFGMLMMILFFFSGLPTNIVHGFVNVQVLYFAVLLALAGSMGRLYSLDAWAARQSWVQERAWLRKLF